MNCFYMLSIHMYIDIAATRCEKEQGWHRNVVYRWWVCTADAGRSVSNTVVRG